MPPYNLIVTTENFYNLMICKSIIQAEFSYIKILALRTRLFNR